MKLTITRMQAAQRGETKYFGRPCMSCRATERYVANGNCVDCTRRASQANRMKIKEAMRQARERA